MYSLEKSEQSFLRDDVYSSFLDFCLTGGRLKRWRLFGLFCLMGSVIGTVWFTCLSSTYVSYCLSPSFSICRTVSATAVSTTSLLFRTRRSLLYSANGVPISLMARLSDRTSWANAICACLISYVHGDVHLCPASSQLIPQIPELNEPSRDQIPSSDEDMHGSPPGPRHHRLPPWKHCSAHGISWHANFYFSSEIYFNFFGRYLFPRELSFTFCEFDTVAFLIITTVVIRRMLMLISYANLTVVHGHVTVQRCSHMTV